MAGQNSRGLRGRLNEAILTPGTTSPPPFPVSMQVGVGSRRRRSDQHFRGQEVAVIGYSWHARLGHHVRDGFGFVLAHAGRWTNAATRINPDPRTDRKLRVREGLLNKATALDQFSWYARTPAVAWAVALASRCSRSSLIVLGFLLLDFYFEFEIRGDRGSSPAGAGRQNRRKPARKPQAPRERGNTEVPATVIEK